MVTQNEGLNDEWKKFTVRVENSIREKLTSNLFCQLYFKERFALKLAGASSQSLAQGLEFDEPLNIAGGNGRRKIGCHKTVLRAVELIGPFASEPLFLMVTPQKLDQNEVASFVHQTNGWQGNVRG